MAFVRILTTLMRDKNIGKRVVPIVPDESRTFGMEGMFRQLGIYSQGQLYTPQDARPAHVLQGRQERARSSRKASTRPARMSSWIAAAHVVPHARRADDPVLHLLLDVRLPAHRRPVRGRRATCARAASCSAAPPDARRSTAKACSTRTATRTSSSATIPNCISYDPTFAYEVAVIIQDGMRRMYAEQEDVYYYITVMNENYAHPAMPAGCGDRTSSRACTCCPTAPPTSRRKAPRVQLWARATILREVIAAAELLKSDWGVAADIWSCPTFTELRARRQCRRRAGTCCIRPNAARCRTSSRASTTTTGRSSPPPTTCACSPTRSVRSCRTPLRGARHRRLRPLRYAREAAHLLRGQSRTTSRSPRSRRWPTTARSRRPRSRKPSRKYGIDPDKPAPWTV